MCKVGRSVRAFLHPDDLPRSTLFTVPSNRLLGSSVLIPTHLLHYQEQRPFMLSRDSRQRFFEIAQKIKEGKDISLEDALFAGRMAEKYQEFENLLKKARRQSTHKEGETDPLDEFLDDLNLGDPDPRNHLEPDSTVDDFANFFRRNPPADWRRTD